MALTLGSATLTDRSAIAFSQSGAGADVLLIHGALVTREDMVLALAAELEGEFRVTAVDRPGHGESTRVGWTGSPWRQAEALHEAACSLKLERPVLVGHSHGGAVALAYAMQFPRDVAGIVALAPIAFPELRLEHLVFAPRGLWPTGAWMNQAASPWIDSLLLPVLWRAMFMPQEVPARYAAVFPYAEAGSVPQTEAEGEDALLLNEGLLLSALSYAACDVPARIFGGDRDLVVNNAVHGQMAERLLPNGRYRMLRGLGHMLHHFAQPAIAQAVRDLMART